MIMSVGRLTVFAALLASIMQVAFSRGAGDRCFCQVTGNLDDCACDVETIDAFNNDQLFPKLQKLLESDYFRFYKVNLDKPCPFWTDNNQCGMSSCAVQPCSPVRDPVMLPTCYAISHPMDFLTVVCSEKTREALQNWNLHDDEAERFCVIDDVESPDAQYVDLLLNPERFTGYKGPAAWQIWNSIYEENCFKVNPLLNNTFVWHTVNPGCSLCVISFLVSLSAPAFYRWLDGQCVEKRAFYRLISGLHSSINIHLSARYLMDDNWFQKKWSHNVSEFQQRFDSELTAGEGPKRLRNLYFLYLIELRALAKALPFFQQSSFQLYTGQPRKDQAHKELLLEVLRLADTFPLHFNENSLFAGDEKEAGKLKEDIRLSFKNISRIMDCVGCFKCRLWGKLQTQGLGTALKVLFSRRQIDDLTKPNVPRPAFQLNRQEIVSIFNAFGRISTSIKELKNFRSMLADFR
uniref:ERO1-like protein alpha n=1 Tax=Gadus morhua TaxID=8049 RepID=A0A8C5AGA1_GADMO